MERKPDMDPCVPDAFHSVSFMAPPPIGGVGSRRSIYTLGKVWSEGQRLAPQCNSSPLPCHPLSIITLERGRSSCCSRADLCGDEGEVGGGHPLPQPVRDPAPPPHPASQKEAPPPRFSLSASRLG